MISTRNLIPGESPMMSSIHPTYSMIVMTHNIANIFEMSKMIPATAKAMIMPKKTAMPPITGTGTR